MKRFAFIGLILLITINSVSFSQKTKKSSIKKAVPATQTKVDKSPKISKVDISFSEIFENSVRVVFSQPDSVHKAIVVSTSTEKIEIDTAGPVLAPPNRVAMYNGTRIGDDATLLFKTFYGDFEFFINALAPRTHYFLQVYNLKNGRYEFISQSDFTTLAQEPKVQAHGIVFENVTESSISIKWINGNGDGRIVIVSKDIDPNYPEDKVVYQPIQDIPKEKPNLKNSWVVYDGKGKNNELKLDNLQPGTYYFQIFEYNGDSILRNYNMNFTNTEGNPRAKSTEMKQPQLKPATEITKWGFTLNWSRIDGASTYFLDIATDKDFREKLPSYDEIDIGLNTTYKLMDLDQDKKYYIRIKAISHRGEGAYSNVIEVQTAK